MIIFLPVLQQIVNFYTNQKITLVVSEAALEFTQGLASRGIMVEKVIVVNRKSFNRNLFYKVAFLLKIRRGNFKQSLSPVFSRESIGDTIIAASRSVKRIGWDGDLSNYSELIKKLYNRAYTDFIRNNEGIINEIERNKYFFEQLYHKVWQKSSFISLPLIACLVRTLLLQQRQRSGPSGNWRCCSRNSKRCSRGSASRTRPCATPTGAMPN
jgi:ADP-heptose:LPS heptosyltransferase